MPTNEEVIRVLIVKHLYQIAWYLSCVVGAWMLKVRAAILRAM